MATILMEKIPKIKLYASTNADFRVFLPITVDGVIPTTLATYTWKASIRDGMSKGATKLFDLTCTPTATGVWLQATSVQLTAQITVATDVSRLTYGNLLFEQPDVTGVYIPAAEIELLISVGDTLWS